MGALLLLNLPFLAYAYGSGMFGWEETATTILTVIAYYLIQRYLNNYFHGDDFIYMSIVSICCVVNPILPQSGAYGVKVLIYLGGVLVLITAVNFLRNVVALWIEQKDEIAPVTEIPALSDIVNRFDRGFPMMFAFAPTMILALVI